MKPHRQQRPSSTNRRASALEAWQAACRSLYRLGGFPAQPEGFRVQIRRKHLIFIAPFAECDWIGWVTPFLCCRFVPDFAENLFDEENACLNQNEPSAWIVFPSGETPIDTLYEPRGRITIPDQLAVCAGIKARDEVFVLFRRNALEIWRPDRLTAYCAANGNSPMFTPTGATPAIPAQPMESRAGPNGSISAGGAA